jgi:hypothetical protein
MPNFYPWRKFKFIPADLFYSAFMKPFKKIQWYSYSYSIDIVKDPLFPLIFISFNFKQEEQPIGQVKLQNKFYGWQKYKLVNTGGLFVGFWRKLQVIHYDNKN